jgi:predicted permease
LTLALGIGVNTAVFGLLYDTVLESLPISRPQELVQLMWRQGTADGSNFNWPDYQPLLEPQPALPGLFAYLDREANLRSGSSSERVRAHLVSGAYYSTLGVYGFIGRTLVAADDRPSAARVAVLSYAYWQRRFGRDPSVLGRTIYLNCTPFNIVGVTPPEFYGMNRLSPPDVTYPLHAVPLPDGSSYYVYYFTRLRPGVSLEQARAIISNRFRGLLDEELGGYKSWMGDVKINVIPAATGEESVRFQLRVPLVVLSISVGVVLLICCTNMASLLLSRAAARTREIGVRLAIGASRQRIIRQHLTESVLLGVGGGFVGLLAAYWVHHLLITLLAFDRSAAMQFRLHTPLLAFTAGVSVLSGIVFGIAPALRATRLGLYAAATRGESPGASGGRLGPTRAFLVVQVAASVALLVGATMFVRTLRNLETLDAGFNPEHLLLMTIDPRESRFQGDRATFLLDELTDRVPAVPGVRSAALALATLFGDSAQKNVWVQGDAYHHGAVAYNIVGPGFFTNAGIPLLTGREFSSRDRTGAPLVAIINQAFAREYFPGQNPLGRRFGDQGADSAGKCEIIGVVMDARYTSLRVAPRPAVFQSLWQLAESAPFVLHVRVTGEPGTTAARIRREIQAIDPQLVIYGIQTMTEQVNTTLRQERMFATLSALFGALALVLCCVGLYGVAAYSVRSRTNEIGIRMALGASRANVVWLVLRQTLVLVALGVAIGVPVALACTRFVKSLLFGLAPGEPSSVAIAVLTLAGVAVIAAFLPALRATRIDPLEALRYE